jgi:hypothetical protein
MFLNTGFGYYVDSKDRKVSKFELPKGEHPDPTGHTFVEVNSKEDLDKIILDRSQAQIEADTLELQRTYHKNAALTKLKAIGLLPEEINALIG